MLKRTKLISLLLVLCTGSLFAYPHPCPGSWTVEADYLYLFPTIDDTYFVLDAKGAAQPATTNGPRKNNDFYFHSGFRVGGAYAFCDCERDFQVYYTRLRAKQDRTVRGTFLTAASSNAILVASFQGYAGFASSRNDLLHQRVDGFVDQKILCACGMDLYLQGGFEFAYLRLNENLAYQRNVVQEGSSTVGTHHQRSKAWGIGPQLGLELDYNLCQFTSCLPGTLTLVASSSGSLLVSKTTRNSTIFLNGVAFYDIPDHHTWRIIPALHARFGLNYATCCFSCFDASLEIGYEFNTYVRGLSRLINPFPGLTPSFTNYYNFDVQGLYVNVDFTF